MNTRSNASTIMPRSMFISRRTDQFLDRGHKYNLYKLLLLRVSEYTGYTSNPSFLYIIYKLPLTWILSVFLQ